MKMQKRAVGLGALFALAIDQDHEGIVAKRPHRGVPSSLPTRRRWSLSRLQGVLASRVT